MLVSTMKIAPLLACAALAVFAAPPASSTSVLFIGNSFTFGAGSPVQKWRPEIVTDLNHEGIGGVPALFKSFTAQAGLDYDVSLETHPGIGLDWHLQNKHDALVSRPWDVVVMHGQSTLDFDAPGNPAKLVATTKQMAELLISVNPKVEIHLTATWPRADQTYPETGHWHGQPIGAMARDVRAGYDKAKATSPAITSVIPVGDAWMRAFDTGVADPNPYRRNHAGTDGPLDAGSLPCERGGVLPRSAHGVRRSHRPRSAIARRRRVLGVRARDVCRGSEGPSTSRVRSILCDEEAADGPEAIGSEATGTVRAVSGTPRHIDHAI